MDNTKEQAAIFSALSDPTRLRLLRMLCNQHEPDALCVNALAGLLGVSQPAVSQHLKVLKSIGLVDGERRGYHIHYHVNPEVVKRCQAVISETFGTAEQEKNDPCRDCDKGRKQNVS